MGDPSKGRCSDSLWRSSVVSENSRERGYKTQSGFLNYRDTSRWRCTTWNQFYVKESPCY
jgi:hypothetical protein